MPLHTLTSMVNFHSFEASIIPLLEKLIHRIVWYLIGNWETVMHGLACMLIVVLIQILFTKQLTIQAAWEEFKHAHKLTPSFKIDLAIFLLYLLPPVAVVSSGISWLQSAWVEPFVKSFFSFYPLEWTISQIGHRLLSGSIYYFIFFVLLSDFITYWKHRLVHTRFLWDAHKPHHSTESFNVFYAMGTRDLRFVPTYVLTDAIGFAVLLFLGTPIEEATLYYALYKIIYKAHHVWIHLPFYTSFGPLDAIIVTPAVHYVHHSVEHPNTNFAELFSFFDFIFGTYVKPPSIRPVIGIGDDGKRLHRNIITFVFLPIFDLFHTWVTLLIERISPLIRKIRGSNPFVQP